MKVLEMGIYDDLDKQIQPVLNIDVFSKNVIVFGSHGSGKTVFLKTLLTRMHQNIEPEDAEEIFIVDFGGNLGEYHSMPLVAACFDNSNEENIRRAFKTVESKLEANIKKLKYSKFDEAYRDAKGKKPMHITLIVDNVNSFLADERYVNYQDDLLKFCRDGLSKGLTVIFTANDTSNGVGRFMTSFQQKIAFSVSQEIYIDIFGRKINESMKYPGRGVSIIDGKPREFQTFLPFEDEKKEFSEFVSSLSEIPYRAEKLYGFNGDLTADNFSENSSGNVSIEQVEQLEENQNSVTVGLDYYEHLPVLLNLDEMHSIGIYGKKKFGKSNLLKVLLNSIRKKHPKYKIVFFDDGRNQLFDIYESDKQNAVYNKDVTEFNEFLESNGYKARYVNGKKDNSFAEKAKVPTVFVLQSKTLYQGSGKAILDALLDQINSKAEENNYYFIYSDIKRIVDSFTEQKLSSSLSAVFLLDNIAEFIQNGGSRKTVFGEMDFNELKTEYACCELGDGYYYDVDRDDLKKIRFLKV